MKTTRRILSILLAAVLLAAVCAVSVSAQAVGTITIYTSNTAISLEGHTFNAYKIFDVTFNQDHDAFNYTPDSDFAAVANVDYDTIAAFTGDELSAFAQATYEYIAQVNLAPDVTTVATAQSTVTLDMNAYGYYLIYDETDNDYDVVSAIILTSFDANKRIEYKADIPAVDKTITGINTPDTIDASSVTASFGDEIWFELSSVIPDTTGYTTYTFIFNDTMDVGLTYQNNAVAKMNGTALDTDDYTVAFDSNTNTLTVTIDSDIILSNEGKTITVPYSAVLNANAAVSNATSSVANFNEVYLTYSNDPKHSTATATSTDDTTTVEVEIYVYDLSIFKYTINNDDEVGLAGAVFTLQDSSGAYIPVTATPAAGVYTVDTAASATAASASFTSPTGGLITIRGLAEGTYTLTETTAPSGYARLISPITVNVSSTSSTVRVLNESEGSLPSTGGMGTVLFTVGGILLMAGAVVAFLLMKKRSKPE